MKNAMQTDAVSQPTHSFFHSRRSEHSNSRSDGLSNSRSDGLSNSRTDGLTQSVVGSLTRSRDTAGYIAPRTLAKMRDENYLKLARQRFLSDLPFSTPNEAVEAGARSVTDWCLCLADAKSEFGRGDYPNN